MSTITKVALTVGLLVIATIIAVLPRKASTDEGAGSTENLSALRAATSLAECPSGDGQDVHKLEGVLTTCLGDGSRVELGQAIAGRDTLINVWAPWCQPCKTELPVLAKYATEQHSVQVLLVEVAGSEADGLALLQGLGVHLPSVFDGEGATGPVREKLAVALLPSSYLVTADGRVRYIHNPPVFPNSDAIRAAIDHIR
ncbi:TlpA disulfide reductase family protein [Amycolatopsis carbonis]|uniref:TlpA disulfide reductase family protein n=1 Tax=Amycolatopsis carbonis TaxID=715471 RepID=A0A9Y2I9V7_9PSEU|nr:TlpA disulfide reductase family protein [Amycolatopsis sp. 2-15]WIX75989.1 TlpA disulfide reductase family protein [Amycolatopsis sp. 2-15]